MAIAYRDATHVSIVVKGNEMDARRAAADHAIPFTFVRETTHGETVGLVPARFIGRVRAWFNETSISQLPKGSMLIWSEAAVAPSTRVQR